MLTRDANLPCDVIQLQTMVLDLYAQMEEMSRNHEVENRLLRERIHQLQYQLYSGKSEKLSRLDDGYCQSFLFSELAEEEKETIVEEISIAPHKRKRRGRKRLSESILRVEVEHDLSEEEKRCGCGCEMSRMGQEISEQLEMQPPRVWVMRHIRYKYACKNCEGLENDEGEGAVKIAAAPLQLIPKSIATPSLLSHILVSKFSDSLPFYRQERQFLRLGVKISRASMCSWAMKVSEKVKPLLDLLRVEVLSGPLIQIDETTVQVLSEPDRSARSKSYMWIYRGGAGGKAVILYRYHRSRGGDVAASFLQDYRGYVQTDGYSGYDFLDNRSGIVHVGCWAHVRRKFFEVVQASKKGKSKVKGAGKAGQALQTIRQLYAIEKDVRNRELSPELVYRERQERSKPILEAFELWLKEAVIKVPPKSLLGKALTYTLSQWPRLVKYLGDGILNMDNNLVENAIRPFVVGRKNWLFSDQPEGAAASAAMYSIIETAKANGLEPYQYLLYLFDKLPSAQSRDEMKELLPQNLDPEILAQHKTAYMERGPFN
jgi:transposase